MEEADDDVRLKFQLVLGGYFINIMIVVLLLILCIQISSIMDDLDNIIFRNASIALAIHLPMIRDPNARSALPPNPVTASVEYRQLNANNILEVLAL